MICEKVEEKKQSKERKRKKSREAYAHVMEHMW